MLLSSGVNFECLNVEVPCTSGSERSQRINNFLKWKTEKLPVHRVTKQAPPMQQASNFDQVFDNQQVIFCPKDCLFNGQSLHLQDRLLRNGPKRIQVVPCKIKFPAVIEPAPFWLPKALTSLSYGAMTTLPFFGLPTGCSRSSSCCCNPLGFREPTKRLGTQLTVPMISSW